MADAPGSTAKPAPVAVAPVDRKMPHQFACPACGQRGKPVDIQTVKAMLAISLRVLRPAAYLFCRTPACPVVYYAIDGAQAFTEAELRERVYQKAPDDETVFVCYCFRHTLGSIRATLSRNDAATIVDDVKAGIQAEACACDIRNPQGTCCLGNVQALVRGFTHPDT